MRILHVHRTRAYNLYVYVYTGVYVYILGGGVRVSTMGCFRSIFDRLTVRPDMACPFPFLDARRGAGFRELVDIACPVGAVGL